MSPAEAMAEALARANRMSCADRAAAARVWPTDWAPPAVVAWILADMCAETHEAISQGFVRAKPMRGRPEKPAPRAVDAIGAQPWTSGVPVRPC